MAMATRYIPGRRHTDDLFEKCYYKPEYPGWRLYDI